MFVAPRADPGCVSGKDVLLGLDSDQEAARAQLKSAMDGLNAAAAKDAKVRRDVGASR